MVTTGKSSRIQPIPRKWDMIQATYRRRVRGLQKRHTRGKSVRAIARALRISHPTLLSIFEDPGKPISRKVMLKVIRNTSARQKQKPRFAVTTGWHVPDAI